MSRRAGYPGTFWPSEQQELALRAALLPGNDGRSAWSSWRDRLDIDAVDAGTYCLLPLIAHNLQVSGVDDPLLGRLAGIRRRAWYQNQLSFSRLGSMLQQLEIQRIRALVLNGAALAVTAYCDAGLRPMTDLDVLVTFEDTARALQVSEADGWIRAVRHRRVVRGVRAEALCRGGYQRLYLHHHVLPALVYRRAERSSAELWQAAVPICMGGVDTRALGSAHQLLHVCVQGASAAARQIGWVADAVHVLRASEQVGVPLDWDGLVRLARTGGVSLAAAATLRYLAETFGATVPAAVLADLTRSPVTARDRALFSARSCRPALGRAPQSGRESVAPSPEQVNQMACEPHR
jgi:Uncharacterised nucleotidyltransferase